MGDGSHGMPPARGDTRSAMPRMVSGDVRLGLGEGPTWDAAGAVAHVVDVDAGTLWRLSDGPAGGATEVLRCGTTLGAAALSEDGGFLLAAGGSLRHVDRDGRPLDEVPLVPASVSSRLNDGGVDPAGRYVVGSLANDGRHNGERLWRLEHDGRVTVLDDDLTLSNGLGWSPGGETFYNVDSLPGTVWRRDYDPSSGVTGERHVLLEIRDGTPDGMTVDSDGNLWIAIWGAGEVRCHQPDGRLLEIVPIGPPLTTSCCFVGPDLRTLLVTTAGKDVEGVEPHPYAGAVFSVDLPVVGLPPRRWRPVG